LSALHLAQLLQPTPAVGGVPRSAALDVIAQLESDRGPLTGAVGWVDGSGDGEFAVTIRAGVLDGERLRLYAGAGIVAGSDPESELRETGAKLATMLKAVGV
jgi:isochorismate synthase